MRRLLLALLVFPCLAFAGGIADSQVSCLTNASTAVGTATARISLCAYNGDSTNPAYIGPTGATTEYIIPAGQGRCFDAKTTDTAGYSAENVMKCKSTGGTVVLYLHEAFR